MTRTKQILTWIPSRAIGKPSVILRIYDPRLTTRRMKIHAIRWRLSEHIRLFDPMSSIEKPTGSQEGSRAETKQLLDRDEDSRSKSLCNKPEPAAWPPVVDYDNSTELNSACSSLSLSLVSRLVKVFVGSDVST